MDTIVVLFLLVFIIFVAVPLALAALSFVVFAFAFVFGVVFWLALALVCGVARLAGVAFGTGKRNAEKV